MPTQAGVTDPRAQIAMAEVHDCFTPTELVLMEDLGFCDRGTAWKEELAGTFELDGDLPVEAHRELRDELLVRRHDLYSVHVRHEHLTT